VKLSVFSFSMVKFFRFFFRWGTTTCCRPPTFLGFQIFFSFLDFLEGRGSTLPKNKVEIVPRTVPYFVLHLYPFCSSFLGGFGRVLMRKVFPYLSTVLLYPPPFHGSFLLPRGGRLSVTTTKLFLAERIFPVERCFAFPLVLSDLWVNCTTTAFL